MFGTQTLLLVFSFIASVGMFTLPAVADWPSTSQFASAVSIGEKDALRLGIKQYFVYSGNRSDRDLQVTIRIRLGRDAKMIGQPELLNASGGDEASLKALFQAGRRALYRTSGAGEFDKLPPAKYDAWKLIHITFTPDEIGFSSIPESDWITAIVPNGVPGDFLHGTYPSWGDRTHVGADILAPCGAEVRAWRAGTVVDVVDSATDRNFNSLGYMVLVQHEPLPDGRLLRSLYLHLAEPPAVSGGFVRAGQPIGRVGKTGAAFGCHLHFETRHFKGRFHPVWANIYGQGDQRDSIEFLRDWSAPESMRPGEAALSVPESFASEQAAAAQDPAALMSARFAESCAKAGRSIGPLACPYREVATCTGETCFVDGARQAEEAVPLFQAPGSERRVYTVSAGEHVYAETTDVYVVPCRSTVLGGWPDVDIGETVYRLGYAGEGTFRYWTTRGVLGAWLDTTFRDDPGCVTQSETWVRMRTRSGIVGWTPEQFGFSGASSSGGPMDDPAPEWVRQAALGEDSAESEIASDLVGPDAVLPFSIYSSDCENRRDWINCMKARGANQAAIAFAQELMSRDIGEGYLEEFIEFGRVDIAFVNFPFLANSNDHYFMVNGAMGVFIPYIAREGRISFRDRASQELLRKYPRAFIDHRRLFRSHRGLGHNRQRFVFSSPVFDGCRACDVIGDALAAYDFNGGEGEKITFIGISGVNAFDYQRTGETASARTTALRRDFSLVQYRLNLLGYLAGSMDGVIGPKTTQALFEFQREYCLVETGAVTQETAEWLAKADGRGPVCTRTAEAPLAVAVEENNATPPTTASEPSLLDTVLLGEVGEDSGNFEAAFWQEMNALGIINDQFKKSIVNVLFEDKITYLWNTFGVQPSDAILFRKRYFSRASQKFAEFGPAKMAEMSFDFAVDILYSMMRLEFEESFPPKNAYQEQVYDYVFSQMKIALGVGLTYTKTYLKVLNATGNPAAALAAAELAAKSKLIVEETAFSLRKVREAVRAYFKTSKVFANLKEDLERDLLNEAMLKKLYDATLQDTEGRIDILLLYTRRKATNLEVLTTAGVDRARSLYHYVDQIEEAIASYGFGSIPQTELEASVKGNLHGITLLRVIDPNLFLGYKDVGMVMFITRGLLPALEQTAAFRAWR